MLQKTSLFILVSILVAACSDDSGPGKLPDARLDSAQADSGPSPDSASSSDVAAGDGAQVDALPVDAGFSSCTGSCAAQTLTIAFGGQNVTLERSYYGIDRDQSGNPGVYIEAYHGGAVGCPEESSPTPDQTLILSGLPLPSQGGTVTLADGLVVSLMDFAGDLVSGTGVSKATSAEVTFVAAHTCPSCVGMTSPSHPEGFVALELTATFDEGTISGHLYAGHCDSLDL